MINIVTCDKCVHYKVCGKKDTYEKFVKAIENVSISPASNEVWFAKDCEDVFVDIECKHLLREHATIK
jgi:hypothetical protein